jgi:hypothetical protein
VLSSLVARAIVVDVEWALSQPATQTAHYYARGTASRSAGSLDLVTPAKPMPTPHVPAHRPGRP